MIVTGRTASSPTSRAEALDPPLTGGARVEICIVGAGLAGLMAAYLLARDKRSVMVVDEGPIGGAGGYAEVAHLASRIELPYRRLEQMHGEAQARLAVQGYAAAIDALQAIVRRERIACEFERLDGYCLIGPEAPREVLEAEVAAAQRAGARGVEVATAAPIEGVDSGPCLRYPGQAQFHPTRFLAGLSRAIARAGGRVHCGVGTRALEGAQPPTLMTSGGHRIETDILVRSVAASAPARLARVIALRVPRGSVTPALYWDESSPARCARLRSHGTGAGEVLLVGGEDDFGALEAWARRRFPRAGDVVQRITTEMPRPADGFTFSSARRPAADGVYTSPAAGGSPLSRAAVAGMAIRDFIDGA